MISSFLSSPISFFIYVISLLVAIAVHEFSHAYAADHLGDPTPRLSGRLTLNPFKHIDTFGMIFLLFLGFGWGKPVEIDPYNLKNPRKDQAIISFAGPLSNFILAILLSLLLRLFIFFDLYFLATIGFLLFIPLVKMNIILGVFNLLPIYPLDGFSIVTGLLAKNKADEWRSLSRYGILFLLLMIIPINGSSMIASIISPIISLFNLFLLPTLNSGVM